jgi:signal peptidase I
MWSHVFSRTLIAAWRGARRWLWLHVAAGVVFALVLVESFVTLGLVVPVRVAGNSMSPTLEGPHVEVTCPHCDWPFAVGSDQLPEARPLVCPDCREEFATPESMVPQEGHRVVIDRLRYARRDPQRWEIVVLRQPGEDESYAVKRVVGLPHEKLSFRHGDVYVDNQIARKDLDDQLSLRQLVHRERDAHRLWEPDGGEWIWDKEAWRHTGTEPGVLRLTHPGGVPITDDLASNQRATRQLNLVSDLMLTCRVESGGTGQLVARYVTAPENVEARIPLPSGKISASDVIISWFDQQLLVAVGGKVVERRHFARPWQELPRLEIEGSGELTLSNLEVWRDVYYHWRRGDLHPALGKSIPAGHCFVIGDNVAISSDSRNWEPLGIAFENLVGGVIGP